MTQTIDLANILKRTKEKPMSILIKGIDLPKEGRLKIEITSDGLVWIDTGRRFYAHKDYAIQIDRPHGRLIDGDKLIGEFIDWQYTEAPDHLNTKEGKMVTDHERQYELYLALGEAVIEIANAPTILEAEE